MKKLISIILAVGLLLAVFPQSMTLKAKDSPTQTDIESIIREQIEAFAKSIDQKDADTKASRALANHGVSGGGKKLSVGKNHVLTATLWNSELMQLFLTHGCAELLKLIQQRGDASLYIDGRCNYYSSKCFYSCQIYGANGKLLYRSGYVYYQTDHAYDVSLIGMGGNVKMKISVNPVAVDENFITYDMNVTAYDRFDFHKSGGSGFKDFISGIGALLFKEFDWESKVTFQLEVPNECEHSYKTKTTKPTCTAKGYTTYTCTLCGYHYKADDTAKLSHKYDGETDGDCNRCGEIRFLRGDMNGDGTVNSADAVYLLRHSIMATNYPISQSADVNGDGTVNSADAVYLLRHTIMPALYPLK
jgi:hypothetical protein